MALFAEVDAAWGVIPAVLVTLGIIMRTARRDWARQNDTLMAQQTKIAEAGVARALLSEEKVERLLIEKAELLARIARLEEIVRYLSPKEQKP